jgi:hypothetical protein
MVQARYQLDVLYTRWQLRYRHRKGFRAKVQAIYRSHIPHSRWQLRYRKGLCRGIQCTIPHRHKRNHPQLWITPPPALPTHSSIHISFANILILIQIYIRGDTPSHMQAFLVYGCYVGTVSGGMEVDH